MRRPLRILLNAVSVLSLVLALLVAGVWLRDRAVEFVRLTDDMPRPLRIAYEPATPYERETFTCLIFSDRRGIGGTYDVVWGAPPWLAVGMTAVYMRMQATWSGSAGATLLQIRIAPAWLIAASLILPIAVQAARTAAWARRRRRNAKRLCPTCGYDVRATPDRCPACGAVPAGPRAG